MPAEPGMASDAVVILIAVFGVLLLALACQRLFRARFLAATGSALTGVRLQQSTGRIERQVSALAISPW